MSFVYCDTCNEVVPRTGTMYIKANNHVQKCPVCKWKEKHKDRLSIEGYSIDEINKFLSFFINFNSIYINDIADDLNRSIEDMIYLFKKLKIANKKCLVKIVCVSCDSFFDCSIERYLASTNHYCSFDCYTKDKTNKMQKGEASPFYNRIDSICDNCGKAIKITPTCANKKNRFGESNNFCSKQCYYYFRSQYYVREKSPNFQKPMSIEARMKSSISHAQSKKELTILNTKIQEIGNNLLDQLSLDYTREYSIAFYSIDNYINTYNVGIEIMGDYWHANPLFYNKNGRHINLIQRKDIIRDKKKRTFLKKQGIPLLYLWENDLKFNTELCRVLIQYYIDNLGLIENYNSFNWNLNNGILYLKENIIHPYFELKKEEYQQILI